MGNKIRKYNNSCIYCGEPATRRGDHIPSKNLFKGIGLTPIIVPSCAKCNASYSDDEEYFRHLVCMIQAEHSFVANYIFETAVKRSMSARPALGLYMLSKMNVVDLYSPNKIFLGKRTKYDLDENDHKRIFHVIDKYVKGLYFHEYGHIIPSDYRIKNFWVTNKLEKTLEDNIGSYNVKMIKEDIFSYGYNKIPESADSIWAFAFYGKPLFMSFVIPASKYQEMEKIHAK